MHHAYPQWVPQSTSPAQLLWRGGESGSRRTAHLGLHFAEDDVHRGGIDFAADEPSFSTELDKAGAIHLHLRGIPGTRSRAEGRELCEHRLQALVRRAEGCRRLQPQQISSVN